MASQNLKILQINTTLVYQQILKLGNYSVYYRAAISQSLFQGFIPCFKAVSIHDLRVA
jgi:hypothetical protein